MFNSFYHFRRYFLLLTFLFVFISVSVVFSRSKFSIPKIPIKLNIDHLPATLLDVGRWGFWVKQDGSLAHDPYSGGGGGYFPLGKALLIYQDGIVWGAILKNPETHQAVSDTPRVGGIQYRVGVESGWIKPDGSPVNAMNNRIGVYRIRRDWRSLNENDLKNECVYLFHVDRDAVTNEMMESVREQYEYDWKNWPVDLGAPYVDVNKNGIYDPILDSLGCPDASRGDYPGLAQAAQVVWFVVNDLNKKRTLNYTGSLPIGLEIHFTLWTYSGKFNPLSKVIFKRIEIFNKSSYLLDSMYVSLFSDPDIGDYGNDLVGCDSLRNIGFAYNADDHDLDLEKYNLKSAAVVYDLLQGPVVKGNGAQDTAVVDFHYIFEHKNLGMTSFSPGFHFYENPPMGNIVNTLILYNLMRGYKPTADLLHPEANVFLSGPRAGQTTHFPLSGNPVTDPNADFGDIDGQGGNLAPGDRQIYMNSGPFVMEPGTKQDMIVAIIGSLGNDHLDALKQVWNVDKIIKTTYKNLFKSIPAPPATPLVRATSLDDKIVLNWGFDAERVHETELKNYGGYEFEGYTIYQLPRPDARLSDEGVKRLATFDRINGIKDIYGTFISPNFHNRWVYAPIQYGSDSGIKHYFVVNWDSIKNRPLYRGSTYYFAVTAYNYNPELRRYPSIESAPAVVTVTLHGPRPGDRYLSQPEQKIEVWAENNYDVDCSVSVVDPSQVTGHDYEIFFNQDMDSLSSTYGEMVWNLKDLTNNQVKLSNQKIAIAEKLSQVDDLGIPIVDGLRIIVAQKETNKLKAVVEVANAYGPLTEENWDTEGAKYHGNNVWHSLSAPNDVNRFYVSAGGGAGNLERIERSLGNAPGHDFEMRFTSAGGILDWAYNDWTIFAEVPFEMWDVGIGTYEDPGDDIRLITVAYSPDSVVGNFSYHTIDPAFGFPATDWLYARRPLNSKGTYQSYVYDLYNSVDKSLWFDNSEEVLSHIIICDFAGAGQLPQTGTVIRFITSKGAQSNTKFYFTAPGKIENDAELAKKDVEKVNVFPNPYYGSSEQEPDRFTHFVTFNHLPPHVIIRIFTMNGVQVKKLEKNNESMFLRWNLRNKSGFPVASGLYIIRVEMPELHKIKVLKLMVIGMEEVP